MKNILLAITAFTLLGVNAEGQEATEKGKVLVAYFSRSGNTRTVAGQINELTGGTLFEIQTAKAYPEAYQACVELAKKEKQENARPALKTKVEGMEGYDVVFIGFPVWWYTYPMAVATFLESYDFGGKTVIPFCTHGGGGQSSSFDDVVRLTGKSVHREGLELNGGQARTARPQVERWLKGLGMVK